MENAENQDMTSSSFSAKPIKPVGNDAPRLNELIETLYKGGVIPNLARKPALMEGLEIAYELGFRRGFRAAKQEDMPWFDWNIEDKKGEKKEK